MVQILDYRIDRYLNRRTDKIRFGVSVKIAGERSWVPVVDGKDLVLRDDDQGARDYIDEMRAERDGNGVRMTAVAAPH